MVIQNLSVRKAIKLFFALTAVEGILSLIWLLIIPSDPKTAWILGYSRSRVLLAVANLALFSIYTGLFLKSWFDSEWTELSARQVDSIMRKNGGRTSSWTIALVVLYLAFSALWIASKDSWNIWVDPDLILIGVYLSRLAPLLVWVIAFIIQALVILWLLGYRVRVWNLALRIVSVLIFPSLMVFFSFLHEEFYRQITKEDHIIEWLTVAFFLLTALLATIHAVLAKKNANRYFWFHVLVAIGCVFFALEEISWGQRVFNLISPEYFMTYSDQQEINIHNVINEQYSVRTKHVAALVMSLYGVVLPVLALRPWARTLAAKFRVIVPPLILIPGFLLASVMTWDRYFTGQDEEVSEFFFSALLFLVLLFQSWDTTIKYPKSDQK